MREAVAEGGPAVLPGRGTVVIITDDSGVAALTAKKIRAMGYHTQLRALPEADETAVEQMFTYALEQTDQPLTGFIYIAPVKDAIASMKDNSEIISKREIDALKAVFLCAKYFARLFKSGTQRGFFVSAARMDGRLGLGTGGSAAQGGLFGLHKSLGIEWQEEILSKAVDLAMELPPETAAGYLLDEIFGAGPGCAEIGRPLDGRRCAAYLTEAYPQPDSGDNGPEQSDVLLVTGGGRGITAECVIKLSRCCRCGFILLGRTDITADMSWTGGTGDRARLRELAVEKLGLPRPKPSEVDRLVDLALSQAEIKNTLEAIRSAGGRARYVSCDVRDAARLKKILGECEAGFGHITGFIHGAGTIADKRIQRKTAADFDSVFGSKVIGLDNCLNCLNAGELKYLILFSSISGYFGNAGQTDYSMANEVMNKFAFAFKREHPGCKTVSINWGLWEAGSMYSDSIKNAVKGSELRPIPVETGTDYFVDQFYYAQKPGICQIVINCCERLIRPEISTL